MTSRVKTYCCSSAASSVHQAGSECRQHRRMPSRPWDTSPLADEMGERAGAHHSFDLRTLDHVDVKPSTCPPTFPTDSAGDHVRPPGHTTELSRAVFSKGIFPAVDPLASLRPSWTRRLSGMTLRVAQEVIRILQRYKDLQVHYRDLYYIDELSRRRTSSW